MGELVTVQVRDGISRNFAADTRARIASVVGGAEALVEAVRVRVGAVGDGGRAGVVGAAGAAGRAGVATVLAQVNAEVDGRRIRVQEAAADLGGALDRLADGLRRRIATVAGGWAPRPWPGRGHGRGPAESLPEQGRPGPRYPSADPRHDGDADGVTPSVVRRKPAHLVWCSPDAAARTMDAMDFDVHLFTDPATETDAVVYRVGPTGYRLARTLAAAPPHAATVPMTLNPCSAAKLTEHQAVDRLAAAALPFLFYADPADGRGRVLYRRYDGGLGLIAAVS